MKKGPAIGIGVAVIVISIMVGIASLPDEVLIESPSLETSENLSFEVLEEQAEALEEEAEVLEEEAEALEEEAEALEEEAEALEDETEGKVIKIEIQDGVGSGDL